MRHFVSTSRGIVAVATASAAIASVTSTASADVLTIDGTPGTFGTPYGYVGANQSKYWEQYRKGFDGFDPPYPAVTGTNSGPSSVLYSNVRQGCDPTFADCVFRAPGVFVGPEGTGIAPSQRFQLINTATAPNQFDLRMLFMEHNAGGGAPFNTFVSTHGGDNGQFQDPFYGSWGVDGVYMGFNVSHASPTWIVGLNRASHGTAAATAEEPGRTNFSTNVTTIGGTPGANNTIDTGLPSNAPITIDWRLTGNTLEAIFGDTVTFAWAFDPDNPGNADGIDFQGGSFDATNVVPVLFDGWSTFNVTPDQPATTQEMGIVPEPATAAMLASLMLPAAALRRRR